MANWKKRLKALAALSYDLFAHPSLNPPAPATLYTKIAAAAASTLIKVPPLEITAEHHALPTVAELHLMFDEYNWHYFGGKLRAARIEYSTRMTSAGSYSIHERLIRIGKKYHELFPEEIGDTLKHEMLHIVYPTHGAAFKKEAARIGASLRARSHPSLHKPPKYQYACPGCGHVYPRQKQLRMASCGSCSKSGFDPRFKLTLHKRRGNE